MKPMVEKCVWFLFPVFVFITQFYDFWVKSYGNSVSNDIFVIKLTTLSLFSRNVWLLSFFFFEIKSDGRTEWWVPNGWGWENWGILSDEWWVMGDEWWMTSDEWQRFKCLFGWREFWVISFCFHNSWSKTGGAHGRLLVWTPWLMICDPVSITQFFDFWVMSYGNWKHILDVFSFHNS